MAESGDLGLISFSHIGIFQTLFLRVFEKKELDILPQNLKIPKFHVPAIQKNTHIKLNLDS